MRPYLDFLWPIGILVFSCFEACFEPLPWAPEVCLSQWWNPQKKVHRCVSRTKSVGLPVVERSLLIPVLFPHHDPLVGFWNWYPRGISHYLTVMIFNGNSINILWNVMANQQQRTTRQLRPSLSWLVYSDVQILFCLPNACVDWYFGEGFVSPSTSRSLVYQAEVSKMDDPKNVVDEHPTICVGHCNCHIRLFWRCQATCATNTVAPGGTRRRGFWTLRPSIGPGVFARDSAQRQPSSWPSIRMEVAMVQEIGNGVPKFT